MSSSQPLFVSIFTGYSFPDYFKGNRNEKNVLLRGSTSRYILSRRYKSLRSTLLKPRVISLNAGSDTANGEVILGIDVGTSAAKSAVVWIKDGGKQTCESIMSYETFSEKPYHVTQTKKSWYNAVITTASQSLKALPASARVIAIAVTGQMQDLIAAGPQKPSLLENDVLLYSDSRAIEEARRLSRLADFHVQPTSLLAKLALLPNPENVSPGETYKLFFGAADYILHRLSDSLSSHTTDPTTISTTGLSFPPHRNYDISLLERLGLSAFAPLFPQIQRSFNVCSYLSKQAAIEIGCPNLHGIPLVHAGGDAASATFGAHCIAQEDGDYIYVGTSGWIGGTKHKPLYGNSEDLFYLGHPQEENAFIVLASIACAGQNISYAAKTLLGGISYSTFDALASSSPIGAGGVVYLPHLSGIRCPAPNSLATGALCGLRSSTTKAEIARAVVEGVAFAFKQCSDSLNSHHHGTNTQGALQVVGGGSHSEALMNALSGALQRTVRRNEASQVGIRGAALAALFALGRDSDVEQWKQSFKSKDESENRLWSVTSLNDVRAWETARAAWEKHNHALESTWSESP